MVLDITSGSHDRVATGIDIIRSGGRIRYNDIFVGLSPEKQIAVGINTSWLPDNITENSALEEFQVAESQYLSLLRHHSEFDQILSGRPIVYELIYDYRVGAVLLGSYDGNRITWSSPYAPKS